MWKKEFNVKHIKVPYVIACKFTHLIHIVWLQLSLTNNNKNY